MTSKCWNSSWTISPRQLVPIQRWQATTSCKITGDTIPYLGIDGLSMILCLWFSLPDSCPSSFVKVAIAIQDHAKTLEEHLWMEEREKVNAWDILTDVWNAEISGPVFRRTVSTFLQLVVASQPCSECNVHIWLIAVVKDAMMCNLKIYSVTIIIINCTHFLLSDAFILKGSIFTMVLTVLPCTFRWMTGEKNPRFQRQTTRVLGASHMSLYVLPLRKFWNCSTLTYWSWLFFFWSEFRFPGLTKAERIMYIYSLSAFCHGTGFLAINQWIVLKT